MAARRPKDIGTAAETAVTRYAQTNGYPHADRQPLRGNRDQGDITLSPGLIAEVKGGDQARNASDTLIAIWLNQTDLERQNARADIGLLIVTRWRKPTAQWWAVLWASDIVKLISDHTADAPCLATETPVRLLLRDALTLTRHAGYGDPL